MNWRVRFEEVEGEPQYAELVAAMDYFSAVVIRGKLAKEAIRAVHC
jgi:hypothetical protein